MTTAGRVLVTGAHGFIGRELVKHLTHEGWTVLPTTRCPQHSSEIGLDLEYPGFPEKLMRLPHIDAVVHLAATVDFGTDTLAKLFNANVAATSSLLVLAKKWHAHFIFASSALVAGINQVQIAAETPAQPDTPYTQSKWLSEQLIQTSGVRSTILRIGGVFGLEGPHHLGLNRAIKDVVAGKPPTQVANGVARRNYIYVKDVAAIISEVLTRQIQGTHLVAGKENLMVSELLQTLCDVFLPGSHPERVDGMEAINQFILPSQHLPASRGFRESVTDMFKDCKP